MKRYADVIGNEELVMHLRQIVQSETTVHAYLMGGEKGLGKRSLASIFAASLLCQQEQRPCGHCDACVKMAALAHPDLKWVSTDKNSLGVEEIRTQVVHDMAIKPYYGGKKIYIIADAEKMTVQAQNALLKTIEEPAAYGVVILLANVEEGLLPTITSRCLRLTCKPVTQEQLERYLMQRYSLPEHQAVTIASFARGNIGRARHLLNDAEFEDMKQSLISLMQHLSDWSLTQLLDYIANIKTYVGRMDEYFDLLQIWYRDVLLYKATAGTEGLIFAEQFALIQWMANHSTYAGLERVVQAIEQAGAHLRANVAFDLTIEILLIAMIDNVSAGGNVSS